MGWSWHTTNPIILFVSMLGQAGREIPSGPTGNDFFLLCITPSRITSWLWVKPTVLVSQFKGYPCHITRDYRQSMALKPNKSGFSSSLSRLRMWPWANVNFTETFSLFLQKMGKKYSSYRVVARIQWNPANRAPGRSQYRSNTLIVFLQCSWLWLSQQSQPACGETVQLAPGGSPCLGLMACSSLTGCSLRVTNFTLPDRVTLQNVFVFN